MDVNSVVTEKRESAELSAAHSAIAESSRPRTAQVLVTAFVTLFCVVGLALWGVPFFYDFMVRQFGWTHAQVTSGNAISKVVIGPLFGFVAGYIVDRFGPRRVLMIGVAIAGAALVGLAGATTLTTFRLFYLLNALGYVFGGPLPVQVLLSRWFDKSRGKAMAIAYLGIGFGGAVAPWIATALIQRITWQYALATIGVLIIALAFPMAFFLPPDNSEASRQRIAETPAPVRSALASAAFCLLAIGSMCSIAAVSGTQQNLKLFLSLDQHYSQSDSAQVISLVLAFSMAGRLLMGWLADRVPKKYVMVLIYALVVAAIPLLFLAGSRAALYLFAVIFGLGLGGDYMIIPLMTAEIFGVQRLGRLMGIILAADGVAEAVSPWVIGKLRDMSGSYAVGFLALLGTALLGTIAVTALPSKRKPA